jgi:hypothetical protein
MLCLKVLSSAPFILISFPLDYYYLTYLAHVYIVGDYICTAEDLAVIKSIMSAPKLTQFVDIGDALLTNDDLSCLTRDDAFLPGDVSQQHGPLLTY